MEDSDLRLGRSQEAPPTFLIWMSLVRRPPAVIWVADERQPVKWGRLCWRPSSKWGIYRNRYIILVQVRTSPLAALFRCAVMEPILNIGNKRLCSGKISHDIQQGVPCENIRASAMS